METLFAVFLCGKRADVSTNKQVKMTNYPFAAILSFKGTVFN